MHMQSMDIPNREGNLRFAVEFQICPNKDCRRPTLDFTLYRAQMPGIRSGSTMLKRRLLPDGAHKILPEYVPTAIRQDYEEACRIRELSPKASATLSRRCLQGAIRDFWNVRPGRLVDEISQIEERVSAEVWEAIQAVRKIGNIGAHMESDINVIVDVDPGEAELLTALVENLIEDWYVTRAERQARMNAVKDAAATKEAARKGESVRPEANDS